jgi:hypothetical protein
MKKDGAAPDKSGEKQIQVNPQERIRSERTLLVNWVSRRLLLLPVAQCLGWNVEPSHHSVE